MLAGAVRAGEPGARRAVAAAVGMILLAVLGCWGALSLRTVGTEPAAIVTVIAAAAVTACFAVVPLVSGIADPLAPARFTLFDLRALPLSGALVAAGMLSVPLLGVIAVAVCLVVLWDGHGVPWAVAAASGALGVLTCTLLARVCAGVAALYLRERRSPELSALIAAALFAVIVPTAVFLASMLWGTQTSAALRPAVEVLADTPIAAAWAIPARLAAEDPDAWISVVVSVCTVLALWAGWIAVVRRSLRLPVRELPRRERDGLGWFAVMPATATGAVAARSLLYWLRDARYLANIAVIPVVAVLTAIPLLAVGVPMSTAALVPVPLLALLLGWLPHNDLSYDSTAIWMHLAPPVRGTADRIGRLVPVLLIGVPLLAAGVPIAVALHGRWASLPGMTGVVVCLFLSGLGLSSLASAAVPYPATAPGDGPFRQPQRAGGAAVFAQAAVLVGAVAATVPVLWWSWLALVRDDQTYASLALWSGVAIGLGVLVVGVVAGAAVFDRRGAALLEAAQWA